MSIKKIALGENHTLFLTNDGDLIAAGNYDGTNIGKDNYTKLMSNVKEIGCGLNYSVAIDEKNVLHCWGKLYDRILLEPCFLAGDVQAVSCSDNYCLFITKGCLYGVGKCLELGLDYQIKSLRNGIYTDVACSRTHYMVKNIDEEVYVYSYQSGKYQEFDYGKHNKPKQVIGLSCGSNSAMVIVANNRCFVRDFDKNETRDIISNNNTNINNCLHNNYSVLFNKGSFYLSGSFQQLKNVSYFKIPFGELNEELTFTNYACNKDVIMVLTECGKLCTYGIFDGGMIGLAKLGFTTREKVVGLRTIFDEWRGLNVKVDREIPNGKIPEIPNGKIPEIPKINIIPEIPNKLEIMCNISFRSTNMNTVTINLSGQNIPKVVNINF